MSERATFTDRFQTTFLPAGGGIVALADHLIHLFGEQGALIEYREGRCWCRPLGTIESEGLEVPLSKSLFRAVLARVAAMCNERCPGSVSPYGGAGDLVTGGEPGGRFHVVFFNTAQVQRLEVTKADSEAETRNGEHGPPNDGLAKPVE